jgi:hypothetical protein
MMHDLKFGRSVGCFKSSTTYRFALHKHQEWKLVHARILLLGDEGPAGPRCTDEEIVAALDVGLSTIGRVRRRFVTESLESAIHPRPRPPRPDKVKIQGEVERHLIRLACSDPPAGRCC